MPYYTRFHLSVAGKNRKKEDVFPIHFLREKYEGAMQALCSHGKSIEKAQWYTHEQDLKEFSKEYPNHIFALSGIGDDVNFIYQDIWVKYFQNGKMQYEMAKVTIDAPLFDPEKLK